MNHSESSRRNLILFMLIIALLGGATVELGSGSAYSGIFLFTLALILMLKLRIKAEGKAVTPNILIAVLGALIIVLDIGYNYVMSNRIGSLDTPVLLLGVSLLASNVKNKQVHKIAIFCAYMSLLFILLFIVLFVLIGYATHHFLNIVWIEQFNHYFITLPTTYMCNIVGVPISIVGIETVLIHGTRDMSVEIGPPCSGFYSMFMLISIIIAYSLVVDIRKRDTLKVLLITLPVVYVANLFRTSILYIVAYLYGTCTMTFVHTHLGWVIFAVVTVLCMWALSSLGGEPVEERRDK